MADEEWVAIGPGASAEDRARVQQVVEELRPGLEVDDYIVRGVTHAEMLILMQLPVNFLLGGVRYAGYQAAARAHDWFKRIRTAAGQPDMPITVRDTEFHMEVKLDVDLPIEAYQELPEILASLDLDAFDSIPLPRWLEYQPGQGWVTLLKDGWGPPPRRPQGSA